MTKTAQCPPALSVTNQEFLTACFGTEADNAHVTGFVEDPGTLEAQGKKGYWGGTKWARSVYRGDFPKQNAYFAISVFDDEMNTGRARRVKGLFRSCHVIVVDDVGIGLGSKVHDTTNLPVPSWVLETSPGNHQWGFILGTPERDAGRVAALVDGMIAQGLASDGKDPGMKGITRYVRLPEGVNAKAKYGSVPFQCVLRSWAPGRTYTMDELARPWGITLSAPGTVKVSAGRGPVSGLSAASDELWVHLDGWGMVTGRTSDGTGFDITCPWVGEHTDKVDTGTAYWLGGGFKCHHGHCEAKGRRELEAWIDSTLRAEGRAGLAARDFKDADKPLLDKFWNDRVSGRPVTSGDVALLAAAPDGDVNGVISAAGAILGIDAASVLRRVATARRRQTRDAYRAVEADRQRADRAACGTVVDAPTERAASVPLADAREHQERALEAIWGAFQAAGGARPLGTVLLRDSGRRAS